MASNENITTLGGYDDSDCFIFPDNPQNCLILACIRIIVSVISAVGCIFTIFLIWLLEKYRSFTQRMVVHLAVASLILALGYLMEGLYVQRGTTCQIQAFLLTFAQWAILLWMILITVNLYLNVNWETSLMKREYILCFGSWGFSAVMATLPFTDHQYGPAGVWCWIENSWGWRFGIWYIEAFISIIAIFIITILTSVIIRRKTRTTAQKPTTALLEKDVNRLRLYPFAYLCVMLFPTINRLNNAVSHETYIFPLLVLQTLAAPLIGAVNAAVFGVDKETFAGMKALKQQGFWLSVKTRALGMMTKTATIHEYHQHVSPTTTAEPYQDTYQDINLSAV